MARASSFVRQIRRLGGAGGLTARVLELKKRTRMVWFWSDGSEEHGQTRIMFELRTEGDGTRRFVTVATRGRDGEDGLRAVANQTSRARLGAGKEDMKTKTLTQTVMFKGASPREVDNLVSDS